MRQPTYRTSHRTIRRIPTFDAAKKNGFTVVNIKSDWKAVFVARQAAVARCMLRKASRRLRSKSLIGMASCAPNTTHKS